MIRGALSRPTPCDPKDSCVGEKVNLGSGATAVPERGMTTSPAFDLITTWPDRTPPAVGSQLTEISQASPERSGSPQVLARTQSAAASPEGVTVRTSRTPKPRLVTISVLGSEVSPTAKELNLTLLGLTRIAAAAALPVTGIASSPAFERTSSERLFAPSVEGLKINSISQESPGATGSPQVFD